MKTFAAFLAALLAAPILLAAAPAKNPVVEFKTSMGSFKVELYQDKAPESVKNFLRYVDEKYYDGTIFHRVMKDFMIQGGGFDKAGNKKQTHEPIKNEGGNGLKNEKGTIAMARTSAPDSATSQFFINTVDNAMLDRANTADHVGYAVFGKVTEGMDTIEKIRAVPVTRGSLSEAVPNTQVVIESAHRVGGK
jgi:cyclophilin family peptidyl-prolyl cis-trans isomerase